MDEQERENLAALEKENLIDKPDDEKIPELKEAEKPIQIIGKQEHGSKSDHEEKEELLQKEKQQWPAA